MSIHCIGDGRFLYNIICLWVMVHYSGGLIRLEECLSAVLIWFRKGITTKKCIFCCSLYFIIIFTMQHWYMFFSHSFQFFLCVCVYSTKVLIAIVLYSVFGGSFFDCFLMKESFSKKLLKTFSILKIVSARDFSFGRIKINPYNRFPNNDKKTDLRVKKTNGICLLRASKS